MDYTTATIDNFIYELKNGATTPDEIRANFKKYARAVHPDLNPGMGQEPMKRLNLALEKALRGWDGKRYQEPSRSGGPSQERTYSYSQGFEEFLAELLTWAATLPASYSVELCGSWLWVGGTERGCRFQFAGEGKPDLRPSWTTPDEREIMFQWSGGQKRWYLDTRRFLSAQYDKKKKRGSGLTMNGVRAKYGSQKVNHKEAI